jgi:REP element-mobilizing transposase RayT
LFCKKAIKRQNKRNKKHSFTDKKSSNMSRYKILDQKGLNYLTITTVGWIDVFTRQRYRDIIIDSLKYCQEKKGLRVCGYVIMSNHIHIIAYTEGNNDLSDVIRDFKKFTANGILKSIKTEPESRSEWLLYLFKFFAKFQPNREHQFWQKDNHPIALWSQEVIWQKLNYIHLNPVRAGLVENSFDYIYSSAGDYHLNRQGLIDLVLVEPIGPVKPIY